MNRVSVAELQALFRQYGADAWLQVCLQHGMTFRLQHFVVTCDARLVEPLMLQRAHTRQRSIAHRFITRVTPGSGGILFLDGERWEVHRRAIAPTFTREHAQLFAEYIHASTFDWAAAAPAGSDLASAINELGASHVLRSGYGLDPREPLAREYARQLIGYKQRTMRRESRGRMDVLGVDASKLLDVPWLLAALIDIHRRIVRMRRIVPKLQALHEICPAATPNWIDGFADERLSLHESTDGLNHLYGAYDAVNFVITAALFELSRHPAWRDRVRMELNAALAERAYPSMDDVSRLPILWSTIREVLRLYPVAGGIFRQTGAPLAVDGDQLPSGTQVVILPYALHRHPTYWEHPESFAPERWMHGQRPAPAFAYLPFLTGPRKCMGQPLAELELMLVLATLTRSFDVHVPVKDASVTPFLVPRFATDLPFSVRPIDQSARQPAA